MFRRFYASSRGFLSCAGCLAKQVDNQRMLFQGQTGNPFKYLYNIIQDTRHVKRKIEKHSCDEGDSLLAHRNKIRYWSFLIMATGKNML